VSRPRNDIPALDPEEIRRYSRHLTLPDVGAEGQLRLRGSSVAVVGLGGLGSPAALYLAAAGVGRLGLIDHDRVALSNLQRQVLYRTGEVDRFKTEAARQRVRETNPHVRVELHQVRLSAANAMEILARYDVVLDGSDNFPTRYLVNDTCALLGKPDVYGSVYRFEGQAAVFDAARGPCYRCLYPRPPAAGSLPDCAEGGVLGVLPGIVGSVQAAEVLKLILGRGEPLVGRLLWIDALEMRFREIGLRKREDCPLCGANPRILRPTDAEELACAVAPEEGAVPFHIEVADLKLRLDRGERPLLIDVRTEAEREICRLDGARLIPLHQLSSRMDELDAGREIVVYCHVGVRSALAVRALRRHGFPGARNLAGGIDAWALRIDPAMARY
jgi:adenylyltransferase/sulfurtransferase